MKQLQLNLPMTLTDEELHLRKLQEQLREVRKAIAEKRVAAAAADAPIIEKKSHKISVEEAEEATQALKKKIQEGAVLVKKSGKERSIFKRARRDRLNSVGEDGEIMDEHDICGSPTSTTSSSVSGQQ